MVSYDEQPALPSTKLWSRVLHPRASVCVWPNSVRKLCKAIWLCFCASTSLPFTSIFSITCPDMIYNTQVRANASQTESRSLLIRIHVNSPVFIAKSSTMESSWSGVCNCNFQPPSQRVPLNTLSQLSWWGSVWVRFHAFKSNGPCRSLSKNMM